MMNVMISRDCSLMEDVRTANLDIKLINWVNNVYKYVTSTHTGLV